jgi:soluble lytic murein transglycosylase
MGAALMTVSLAAAAPYATAPLVTTPQAAYGQSLSPSDTQGVTAALLAARSGNGDAIRAAMAGLDDPVARKIALYALSETAPDSLSYLEADNARRDLAGWPQAARREAAAENKLEQSGMGLPAVVAWFGGGEPQTPAGALSLATALNATGRGPEAAQVVRRAWRTMVFDLDVQTPMLARFSGVLAPADHVAREDLLLYGPQGPAATALRPYLPADQRALSQARMAVRRGDPGAPSLIAALPQAQRTSPGLAYERVLSLRARGDDAGALALMAYLPEINPMPAAAERLWKHGALVGMALSRGAYATAYAAAAHSGLSVGGDAADAAFYAGWIALTRLRDPRRADEQFARLQSIGLSPLTQSRALYWRGRAAEALGDQVAAQSFYGQGARYYTTFYGQLAAAQTGVTRIVLEREPEISAADRARFEGREPIRAARIMAQVGAKDSFRAFVAALADTLPTAPEEAMLVDLARAYGDQEISMHVVRNAARRGFILPERGYPLRSPALGPDAPEVPFVLGIIRQESSFDPHARSGAGARGMMQLMPDTASRVARKLGLPGDLEDPDYNVRLGSAYLGQLVGEFSGSYVMAAAAYNAGPGRPAQWAGQCGDPRGSSSDPIDFIECIPFSETRDYVMRVMEATEVYRARMNGGSGPNALAADLKRGADGAPSGL